MIVCYTNRFERQYAQLSDTLKGKVDKQIEFLSANLHHPSLRAKKYDEARGLWQARVDRRYRFYSQIEGDTCTLLSVVPHPK
jgi:mRNA-degrading endonuclease RelE of RelBE toxin-antitoxin system